MMSTTSTTHILILEDVIGFTKLLCSTIRRTQSDCEIRVAKDITDAEKLFNENPCDLIFALLTLSHDQRETSLNTLRQLKSLAVELPIIVVTGVADRNAISHMLSCGVHDVILVDQLVPEALMHALRCNIARAKLSRTAITQTAGLRAMVDTSNQFVDNVSHEFRTPLTVIREYASLMQDGLVGAMTDEQSEFLGLIADRADDLNIMVDDLLDSSRLGAERMGICRHPVHVEEVMKRVQNSLERKANVRDVELRFDVPKDLPKVYCDPEKAGRVLINLATNAIKFCGEPGAVAINVVADAESHEVRFSVTDNGPGIEPADLKLLFDRFRQLGTSIKETTKGFGLGLNISRELVDLNFGSMNVESQPGCGSTFTFTLPLNEPLELLKRYLERVGRLDGTESIGCLTAHVSGSHEKSDLEDINAFWRYTLRRNDFVLRPDDCSWSLYLPMNFNSVNETIERVRATEPAINRG